MQDFSKKQKSLLIALVLVALTLAVYWPVQDHSFLNYDDPVYVTQNAHIKEGLDWERVKWAFTTMECGFYQPLTWLTYLMDFELYRLNAGGYHWTNLIFHIANTILLFWVLALMTGRVARSGFVAVLFALHPLHVESVAWIAERKDVLSGFFWFLTMGAYFYYTRKPGLLRYMLVLAVFVLGLMSKPMAITLPLVLLLLDFWPLQRFRGIKAFKCGDPIPCQLQLTWYQRWGIPLFIEKIPMILISLCFVFIAFITVQKVDALPTIREFPLDQRLGNVLIAYGAYMRKMFVPWDLYIPYLHPVTVDLWMAELSGISLILISLAVYFRNKSNPYLAVGWLWYFGTLIPVIGLVQIGLHSMGDRYTYIPLIGLFIALVWGISDLLGELKYRRIISATISVVIIATMLIFTHIQIGYWKNDITLFQHTVDMTENNIVAHNNLGEALMKAGKVKEAKIEFLEGLRISPLDSTLLNNCGVALYLDGEKDAAFKQFNMALRISPQYGITYENLGMVFLLQGKIDEAISYFKRATQCNPDSYKAWRNMASALMNKGDMQGAIVAYCKTVLLDPMDFASHNDLGFCLARQGQFKKAAFYFEKALEIKPNFPDARENLNRALYLLEKNPGNAER